MKPIANDITVGTILDQHGAPVVLPTTILSSEEARMLRAYKKFCLTHGLKTAYFCNTCFDGNLQDGMRAHVTDSEIQFNCRHRMLFHLGQSF
jgi:hypothetical protein